MIVPTGGVLLLRFYFLLVPKASVMTFTRHRSAARWRRSSISGGSVLYLKAVRSILAHPYYTEYLSESVLKLNIFHGSETKRKLFTRRFQPGWIEQRHLIKTTFIKPGTSPSLKNPKLYVHGTFSCLSFFFFLAFVAFHAHLCNMCSASIFLNVNLSSRESAKYQPTDGCFHMKRGLLLRPRTRTNLSFVMGSFFPRNMVPPDRAFAPNSGNS